MDLVDITELEAFHQALMRADRFTAAQFMAKHREHHPRFLYKFASARPRTLIDTALKSRLWLASRRDFNDPFEISGRVVYEGSEAQLLAYFRDVARRHRVPLGKRHQKAEEVVRAGKFTEDANRGFNETADRYGIACFGTDPRSLLMWAYYGSQRGICFQFHSAGSPMPLATALPVRYSDERTVFNWLHQRNAADEVAKLFFLKSTVWTHEGEHRILMRNRARSYEPFNSAALTGVIIGCMASPYTALRIAAARRLRLRRGLPPFDIFRIHADHDSRRLVIERDKALEARSSAYRSRASSAS